MDLGSVPAAVFKLLPASTGAGIIALRRLLGGEVGLLGHDAHDVGGWTSGAEQLTHDVHAGFHVIENALVGGAKVVESRFAIRCFHKAVFGAFAMAGKAH